MADTPTPPPPDDTASQFAEGVSPHPDTAAQFAQGVAPAGEARTPQAPQKPAAPAKQQPAQGKAPAPPRAQQLAPPPSRGHQGQSSQTRILVLNGPNLNMLGRREPEIYGNDTLDDLAGMLKHIAERHEVELIFEQSNHEGQLIDWIHQHIDDTEGLIINPGALTHTSYALRDALAAYPHEIVEVHLSNVHNREEFREKSVVAPIVTGTISGFGMDSYRLALLWLVKHLEKSD